MAICNDPVAELVGVVDSVCGTDPSALADGAAIETLYRQLDRLEAAVCRASAAFDSGGDWQAEGARSGAAWIATRRRCPGPPSAGGCCWVGLCAICRPPRRRG